MELKRLLFISTGIILGVLAREYLTGVYNIIFQSVLWTGMIAIVIDITINKYKNSKLE